MSVPAELTLNAGPSRREISFWLLAGVTVFVLHAAFASMIHAFLDAPAPVEADEQALVIDLAPLPISLPEIVETETAPEIEPSVAIPQADDSTVAVPTRSLVAPDTLEPVEAANVAPQPPDVSQVAPEELSTVEPAPVEPLELQASLPATVPPIEVPLPEIKPLAPIEPVQTDTPAEVVTPVVPPADIVTSMEIAPSVAVPVQPEQVEPEIVEPTPETRKPVKREPAPKPRKKAGEARQRAKPKPDASKETASAAAPARASSARKAQQSKAPLVDPSRWNSAVRAAVARQAGRARGTRGTVRVQFEVSAAGAVVSARVSGSSGNPRLDGIALDIVRSARVPRPPEGLAGGRHSFAIPLTFR